MDAEGDGQVQEPEEEQQERGGLRCDFAAGPPQAVYAAWRELAAAPPSAAPNTNFLKLARWSPDGSCCLAVADDNLLRVFDLPRDVLERAAAAASPGPGPDDDDGDSSGGADDDDGARGGAEWPAALTVPAGEAVYDAAWFPGMSAADPVSCCFASTGRGQPIRMWDACSGELRASYRAYDDADEVTAASSLAMSPDGATLVGGYGKALRAFDVSRPGRDCQLVRTQARRREGSLPGIVSCLAFDPGARDLLAAGTYGKAIGLFDARTREQVLRIEGAHRGGLTHLAFSPTGHYLYSGARRDGQLHCWDVRVTGGVVYSLARATEATNQRVGFSVEPCGRHLATGGADGAVRVYDLRHGTLVAVVDVADDTVAAVDFSPCLSLLVTASGHRRYPLLPRDGWASPPPPSPATSGDDGDGGGGWGGSGAAAAAAGRGATAAAAARKRPRVGGKQQAAAEEEEQLSLAGWRPGFRRNALRLWRVASVWEACGSGGSGGAGAAAASAAVEGGAAAGAEGRAASAADSAAAVGEDGATPRTPGAGE